jgi:hypothetical protein
MTASLPRIYAETGPSSTEGLHVPGFLFTSGELEKFGISFKIEAREIILPQAYT